MRTQNTSHTEVQIHEKRFFDYQKRFLNVLNDATIELQIKANTKNMHLVVTLDAEGKSYFDSYVGTTYTADGTKGVNFNRYIESSPVIADGEIYESPTVNVLGTQRFEKIILGGTGPQSTGASGSERIESVLENGSNLFLIITNKSGQTKDYGITIEWYERDA